MENKSGPILSPGRPLERKLILEHKEKEIFITVIKHPLLMDWKQFLGGKKLKQTINFLIHLFLTLIVGLFRIPCWLYLLLTAYFTFRKMDTIYLVAIFLCVKFTILSSPLYILLKALSFQSVQVEIFSPGDALSISAKFGSCCLFFSW